MIGMIILFIISFIFGIWCIASENYLVGGIIFFFPFIIIISNNYTDYTSQVDIGYNYTTKCYTAIGGFWNPYLEVDCNSTKVDLTKNETTGSYYINKLDKRQCLLLSDCINKTKQ